MCGRFTLTQPASIAAKFGLDNFAPVEPEFYVPRFNVAPTQRIVVIPTSEMQREARRMRWGLIPSWARDASIGARLFNARAEGIDTKPSFRAALKYRRCLIPADGFYEWRQTPRGKQPYRVVLASGELFAFAGLWERWKDSSGETVESVCIITCEPNALSATFHNRMPVIIAAENYETWLTGSPEQALALLRPYPAEWMRAYPVSASVNRTRDDTRDLVDPVPEEPSSTQIQTPDSVAK
jgi:putative SOS response-associated peptidase YedK